MWKGNNLKCTWSSVTLAKKPLHLCDGYSLLSSFVIKLIWGTSQYEIWSHGNKWSSVGLKCFYPDLLVLANYELPLQLKNK